MAALRCGISSSTFMPTTNRHVTFRRYRPLMIPNFFALTPTQQALLGNRGVTPAKINAALSYLDSLTGTIPGRQEPDDQLRQGGLAGIGAAPVSVQYDRARSSSPAGVRSSPVVDVGRASLGSSYAKVDAVLGRWMWLPTVRLSNDFACSMGMSFSMSRRRHRCRKSRPVGPGGYGAGGRDRADGFTFGSSPSLGRKTFPDENKVELVDLVTWTRGRHQLQAGIDLSLVHDDIDSLANMQGAFHYDSSTTAGHAGGLVDWITDYTFNVNAYPNGGCPSIFSRGA